MAIDTTRQLIQQITNASNVGENTATRVGNAMEAMLNDVKAADDKAVAATNRISTTEQGIANANQRLSTEEGINAAQSAQIEGLRQDIQNIRPVTIEGDVVNNPDNVFLTSANDEITPKERTTSLSAKGHYIMRPTDDFAAKLKANYIHEIPFDVDLDGASVTIPAGAVLKFTGGKISGGTIVGSDTAIEGGTRQIFGSDVTFGGTWNVKEVIPEWFGAVGDDSTDDTPALAAMANFASLSGCRRVKFLPKTYVLRQQIFISGDVEVCGSADTNIHLRGGAAGIYINTTNEDTILNTTITEAVAIGDNVLHVGNAALFNVDDLVVIKDTVDNSFDSSRIYYRQGEFIRIKAVDTAANTITLYNAVMGKYGTDDGFQGFLQKTTYQAWDGSLTTSLEGVTHRTMFIKPTLHRCIVRDLRIVAEDTYTSGYYALRIANLVDSVITNIDVRNDGGCAVAVSIGEAYHTELTNSRIFSNHVGSDAYGCSIGSAQEFVVRDCAFGAYGHCIAFGGGGSLREVVNRHYVVENCSFEPTGTVIALDSHAGSEHYTYRNVIAPSQRCDLGGYYMTIDGCKFASISTSFFCSGITIRNTEISGEFGQLVSFTNPWHDYTDDEILIEGCKFGGGIYLNPQNSSAAMLAKSYAIKRLTIRNSVMTGRVNLRGYLAKNYLLDGSRFEEKSSTYSVYFSERLLKDDTETPVNYIVRNCVITSETQEALYFATGKKGNAEITGNSITAFKSAIFAYDTDFLIKGNRLYGETGINLDGCDARVMGNYIELKASSGYNVNVKGTAGRRNKVYVERDNVLVTSHNFRTDTAIPDDLVRPFGTSAQLPQGLTSIDEGREFYNTTFKQMAYYNGTKWVNHNGTTAARLFGTTADRPVGLNLIREGSDRPTGKNLVVGRAFKRPTDSEYYIAKAISGDTVTWEAESTYAGKAIGDVARYGTMANAPSGNDIYVGFVYINSSDYSLRKAVAIAEDNTVTWQQVSVTQLSRSIDNGFVYYDKTLNKFIHATNIGFDGAVTWKDEAGTTV